MAQALYRKWRPQVLADVVAQEHVTRTLRQAVLQGKISHAYLFCGPRGTGKTSTARILAKAVNCFNPQDGEPCNECSPCTAVNEGRSLDLVEIDAASHRGIDDVRNLREKVHFTPVEASHKVYIVDEVHMMTTDAFNALLKTLEEPPPHVIFILATTEAHKVLPTVVSRCQRFDFHRISNQHTEERLARICAGEAIEAEPQVLKAIARSATGSLRDAENLLEQLVVAYDSSITLANVRELLGMGDDELAMQLAGHALKGEAREGLGIIAAVADQGLDLRRFHRQVVDHLRGVLLLKAGAGEALEQTSEVLEALKAVAASTTLDRVLRAVHIFGQAVPRQDGPSTLSLELALVDCSLEEAGASQSQPKAPVAADPPAQAPSPVGQPRTVPERDVAQVQKTEAPAPVDATRDAVESTAEVIAIEEEPAPPPVEAPVAPVPAAAELTSPVDGDSGGEGDSTTWSLPDAQWEALRKTLKLFKGQKFNIGSLLLDCRERYIEEESLVLVFRTLPNMERLQEELENPDTRRFLQETVGQVTGKPYALRLSLAEQRRAGAATPTGHLVRAAQAMGVHLVEEEEQSDE